MKSTLKRELNVPEIVVNQAIGINVVKELGLKLCHPASTSIRVVGLRWFVVPDPLKTSDTVG